MARPGISAVFIRFSAIFLCLLLHYSAQAEECGAGRRPLFFYVDPSADRHTPHGFTDRIFLHLKQPLEEIGYCITRFDSALIADTSAGEELVMVLSMRLLISRHEVTRSGEPDSDGVTAMEAALLSDTAADAVVSLLRVDSWSPRQLRRAAENPLLSLAYNHEELTTFESVLMRKIVENLRTQYICNLRIQSIPDGATIRSNRGLEGTTPLEWIMPVGKLSITGELKGYEPIRRRIDLTTPGMHTYVIEMGKRRFYHSAFFIPSIVFGVSSAACFAVERVYYNNYMNLGREDRENNPDSFERTFNIAKNFERAAGVTLALGVTSFTLCFFF